MYTSWLTAEQYSQLSTQVTGAFIAPLPAFETLIVSGADNRKYLQGQITADIEQLTEHNFLRTTHCDSKGKMWSISHLFTEQDDIIVIAFRDELVASLQQWKKFGVFSKVSFNSGQQHYAVFGVGGTDAEQLLRHIGFEPPQNNGQLSRHNGMALLKLANEHYLLVTPIDTAKTLLEAGPVAAPVLWLQQHIQLGFSYLEQPLIGEFIPQMLNLQLLDAISFTKGCYIGQEIVARIKYRGGNKRAAYILTANTTALPAAGTDIELKLNDNWRRTGQVVNAVNINNQLWLIAVLPNDITADDTLRLKSETEETLLHIQPLPYTPD